MSEEIYSEKEQEKIEYICRRTKCDVSEALIELYEKNGDEIEAVMAIKRKRRKVGEKNAGTVYSVMEYEQEIKPVIKEKIQEIKPVSKEKITGAEIDKLLNETIDRYTGKSCKKEIKPSVIKEKVTGDEIDKLLKDTELYCHKLIKETENYLKQFMDLSAGESEKTIPEKGDRL